MAGPGPYRRLLHLGNVVVDVVLDIPALPERGGDVLASRTEVTAGGGFNVLAAAARQGLPASYAGAHGSGPFAALARAALAAEGIEVLLPAKPGLDTGFVVSLVDAAGERTFLTSPGAEAALTAADLAGLAAGPRDVVYLSGYGLVQPSRTALLGWLAGQPDHTVVVFDPGPLAQSIPAAALDLVLGRATWLTCNATEAGGLSGRREPAAAARVLSQRAAAPAGVVVRAGPDGCLLAHAGTEPVHVPGFPVAVADTNGAGDTHTGTFIAALAQGQPELAAARAANAAAALSVTRRGPATAPAAAELARFLAAQAAAPPAPG